MAHPEIPHPPKTASLRRTIDAQTQKLTEVIATLRSEFLDEMIAGEGEVDALVHSHPEVRVPLASLQERIELLREIDGKLTPYHHDLLFDVRQKLGNNFLSRE